MTFDQGWSYVLHGRELASKKRTQRTQGPGQENAWHVVEDSTSVLTAQSTLSYSGSQKWKFLHAPQSRCYPEGWEGSHGRGFEQNHSLSRTKLGEVASGMESMTLLCMDRVTRSEASLFAYFLGVLLKLRSCTVLLRAVCLT